MMRDYIILLLLSGIFSSQLAARENEVPFEIKVGEPLPVYELRQLEHHKKKSAWLSDFKGKWLILDFWSKTCTNCIASFPKVNKLQAELGDKAQFLLIGDNTARHNKGIRALFERIRNFQKLDLAIAYDSTAVKLFGVPSYPFIVVADPDGVIQAIPQPNELTKDYLVSLFTNKTMPAIAAPVMKDMLICLSRLEKWKGENRYISRNNINHNAKEGSYQVVGTTLERLYNVAYYGELEWSIRDSLYQKAVVRPILELADTSDFLLDYNRKMGMYNYELVVEKSKANSDELKRTMQADLHRLFGYTARIETRMLPCWNLVADANALQALRSRSKSMLRSGDASRVDYKKVRVAELLYAIHAFHQNTHPFFDETGITEEIDIELSFDRTNFEATRLALKAKGLNLVLSSRMMKVLVISK